MTIVIKIGIFGFGRIGRSLVRQILRSDTYEISFICDGNPTLENIIYLLQYDSMQGKFEFTVRPSPPSSFVCRDKSIMYYSAAEFDEIDFDKVDFVIDATGSIDLSSLLSEKSKTADFKTIQTNASDPDASTIIVGVNDHKLPEFSNHRKICSGTCDSTGIGTLLRAIESLGNMITGSIFIMHPWSGYQNLLDGPSMMYSKENSIYSNFALGRSAPHNLIPRATSCVGILENIMPFCKNRLQGMCVRVPTSNVCGAQINLFYDHKIDRSNVIQTLKNSTQFSSKLLSIDSDQLVSSDFIGTSCNTHLDEKWIDVTSQGLLRLFVWYDNEWGYASNVLRLLHKLC